MLKLTAWLLQLPASQYNRFILFSFPNFYMHLRLISEVKQACVANSIRPKYLHNPQRLMKVCSLLVNDLVTFQLSKPYSNTGLSLELFFLCGCSIPILTDQGSIADFLRHSCILNYFRCMIKV